MSDSNYDSLIAELQVDYLASFPEKVATLEKYYAEKNWESLELEYHKLKGTGTTYGIPEISKICREMERICRDRPVDIPQVFALSVQLIQSVEKTYKDKEESFDLESDKRYLQLCQQGV